MEKIKIKIKVVQCHLGVKSTTPYSIMLLETGRAIEPLKLPQQGQMGDRILTTEKSQKANFLYPPKLQHLEMVCEMMSLGIFGCAHRQKERDKRTHMSQCFTETLYTNGLQTNADLRDDSRS